MRDKSTAIDYMFSIFSFFSSLSLLPSTVIINNLLAKYLINQSINSILIDKMIYYNVITFRNMILLLLLLSALLYLP